MTLAILGVFLTVLGVGHGVCENKSLFVAFVLVGVGGSIAIKGIF